MDGLTTRKVGAPLWVLACLPGSAVMAATVSVAFACTSVMGPLTITPSSGSAGTTVSTSAQGLKPNAKYAIHFASAVNTDSCMSFTRTVLTLGKVTTGGDGTWSDFRVTIPANAAMGTHSFCGMEVTPVKGQTGTQHMTFTVT